MHYVLELENNPDAADLDCLTNGILAHGASLGETAATEKLCFFLRASDRDLMGGVAGNYNHYGWLYISALWVAEAQRGKGLGATLMAAIEAEALQRGCRQAYLEALDNGVCAFYRHLGYVEFARLENFHGKVARVFLNKTLT